MMHYIYGPKTGQCLSASIDHCKPHIKNPGVLHGEYCIPCLPTHQQKKPNPVNIPSNRNIPIFPTSNEIQTQSFPDLPPQPFLLVPTWIYILASSIDPRNDANSHPNSDSRQLRPFIPVQSNCTLPRPIRLPISFSRYLSTLPTVATTSPQSSLDACQLCATSKIYTFRAAISKTRSIPCANRP